MENEKMKEKFIHGIFVVDCALLTRASYNEHTSSFDNHREWAQWGIPSTNMHNKHFLPHSWLCSELKVLSLPREWVPFLSLPIMTFYKWPLYMSWWCMILHSLSLVLNNPGFVLWIPLNGLEYIYGFIIFIVIMK